MTKKLRLMLTVFIMMVALTACGGDVSTEKESESSTSGTTSKKEETVIKTEYDDSTLEGILEGIQAEVEDVTEKMAGSLNDVNEKIGDTYEEYVENKQELTNWYDNIIADSEKLFARIKEMSVQYFKLAAKTIDHEDYNAMDDALDEYYDVVYDDVMDDYYDAIYDDLMDEVYETYYDGVVEEGYDIVAYKIYSEESSACYKAWSSVKI